MRTALRYHLCSVQQPRGPWRGRPVPMDGHATANRNHARDMNAQRQNAPSRGSRAVAAIRKNTDTHASFSSTSRSRSRSQQRRQRQRTMAPAPQQHWYTGGADGSACAYDGEIPREWMRARSRHHGPERRTEQWQYLGGNTLASYCHRSVLRSMEP